MYLGFYTLEEGERVLVYPWKIFTEYIFGIPNPTWQTKGHCTCQYGVLEEPKESDMEKLSQMVGDKHMGLLYDEE